MRTSESIIQLKDKYDGERLFILGNGPSLADTPLIKLSGEYTLGLNKISLIYDDTDWRPSFYYCALAPHMINERSVITQNTNSEISCIFNKEWKPIIGNQSNVVYFEKWNLHNNRIFDQMDICSVENAPIDYLYEFWSDNISYFVYHYHAMYSAIQIAIYLGFDEIYLLGCDLGGEYLDPHMLFDDALDPYKFNDGKLEYFRESLKKRMFWKSLANALAMKLILRLDNGIIKSAMDRLLNFSSDSHFTSDYTKLTVHDYSQPHNEIKKSHAVCKRIANDKNITIKNATIGGELELYDRVNLDDLI